MIVLGITPGLRSLAYCVLLLKEEGELEVLDSDLLKGGRVAATVADEAVLKKKSKPHALTLAVVLERAFEDAHGTPVLMAIGPGTGGEPEAHVFFVRVMLAGLTVELAELGVRIDCVSWEHKDDLDDVLGEGVKKAVRRALNRAGTNLIRSPYVLAAGTALAGAAFARRGKISTQQDCM